MAEEGPIRKWLREWTPILPRKKIVDLLNPSEWEEVALRYSHDPKVSEMLKRIGPPFPLPGPHYSYGDFIEHIRYTLFYAKRCELNTVISYHIPEIFKRQRELHDALVEASPRYKGQLSEEEYWYAMRHISDLYDRWTKEFEQTLARCMRG